MAPSLAGMSMFCRTIKMLLFVCGALHGISGDGMCNCCMRVNEQTRCHVSTRADEVITLETDKDVQRRRISARGTRLG